MSTAKRKIILKKLSAFNTVWHPDSGLVFKSQKERSVIGSYVDNNIVDLDENSLALCEEWNFKPDESLFVNQEEEPSEGDDEDQDNQEEEQSESADEDQDNQEEEQSESAGDEDQYNQEEEQSESAGDADQDNQDEEHSESAGEEEHSRHKENVLESNRSEVGKEENSGIQPHLIKFQKDVDILSKDLASTLSPLFAGLQTKIMQLESELKQKTHDNEELQSKYNAMDQKFKTMKSLFS